MKKSNKKNILFHWICLFYCITAANVTFGQQVEKIITVASPVIKFPADKKDYPVDVFGTTTRFIENAGQYGDYFNNNQQLGKILFGYEGFAMPVLLTTSGFIQLQRKLSEEDEEERERKEKKGVKQDETETKPIDKYISVEWLGANANSQIITEEKTSEYHTYGMLQKKAFAYKKITYVNLYPNIDLVYQFSEKNLQGFEYRFIIHPGGDINAIQIKFGGDARKIKNNSNGLIAKSSIGSLLQSAPVSFYKDNEQAQLDIHFSLKDHIVNFESNVSIDKTKELIIDPFVSTTNNLLGLNAGKAKDVDFDYAGNVYVTGGGSQPTNNSLAKYNAAGTLQWTFSGSLNIPSWTFGTYYGGWMVEKPTGNVYMGQGFNYPTGFQVIRLSSTGLYDNYITTANGSFTEAWKMFWNCNNGTPQILIAGGGINSDINFGVFTPPSTAVSSLNVTGITYSGTAGWAQDIADFVFDPANNDMYCIYGSLFGTPSLNNKIYKNTAPYSAASIAWNTASGYSTVSEAANRPYMVNSGLVDNSANMLCVNASYLYYWDGKNLKAFNKTTGTVAGTPLTTANTAFMQGGIIADACNNVFVGGINGTIKVYNFNGSTFNDAPADISIPGFTTKSIYDLAYDESRKVLYVSGDGFVTAIDVSTYCPTTFYTINITPNCVTAGTTATLSPTPPPGSNVTYNLFNGVSQIATNTTGVFTGLSPNITYNIIATVNLSCSGSQASKTFTIPAPSIATTQVNTTCSAATGSITATASGGSGSGYTYSINGTTFQGGGAFNGLTAGIYTITSKDGNGCVNTKQVTLTNTNGPTVTFIQTNADCGSNTGTVTANVTGGVAPYQYSINGGTIYQSGNFFTGLTAGQYTLVVKDASGCTNRAVITITTSPSPAINAIPAAATCGQNNGTITAFGTGGTGALQYSINGNTFQAANLFSSLAPGPYNVMVKDANGCIKTVAVTVSNAPRPTVTASSTPAACGNVNGTITASGTGGIAPYQYSLDGINFQASEVFTGLTAGNYTITIQDNSGCLNTINVTIANTNGPTVTATATASACSGNTGSIIVTANGGIAPFQYSINGINFQPTNTFTNIAPGTYVVYVRDNAGCTGTATVTINAVAGPSLTASTTASLCTSNTGSITASGTGGTGALQYSINGTVYQASNNFTGVAPGDYIVYVKDANGCIKTTTVTVSLTSGLTLSAIVVNASCGGTNGIITAVASGGVPALQYSINGTTYQASNVFSNLLPGSYTLYVKDASNCIISTPAPLSSSSNTTLSVTTIDATCGGANGTITASGSGGLQPLTYSINGTTFQSSGTFINVAAGTYTVYVKDDAGCIATQQVTIGSSGTGAAISSFTVRTDDAYLCGDGVGRITNPRVDGSNCNDCTYSLNFGAFVPDQTQLFRDLPPGNYFVTAQNADGCTLTIPANIGIAAVSTASAVVTGTACNTSNGSITITGIGPNTPYHASINGIGGPWITFDPATTFNSLAPGTYQIILSDDESFEAGTPDDPGACLDTITVVVPAIGGPGLTTTTANGTCSGNDGSITIAGTGNAPLSYNINGGTYQASNIFTNLSSGDYQVNIKDGTGCTNTKTVTILNPAPPQVTADITSASCSLDNGIIKATGTGGTPPLQYSINSFSFQPGSVFTGVAPGNYKLYVKDASNCYSYIDITVPNTPVPKATVFQIAANCNNNDGKIIAGGTAGTLPYTFSIDGTIFQSSDTFDNLKAGFYTITLKDDLGCSVTTGINVQNNGGPAFTNTSTAATCSNSNGSISITASGGSGGYQYSEDGSIYQAGSNFTGLAADNYTVYVKDASGCIATKNILISSVNGPNTINTAVTDAACSAANGKIVVNASGGTGILQYSVDGSTYTASNTFNSLTAGTYTVYVRDANLCIKTTTAIVANLQGPSINLSGSNASCGLNDGTITVATASGTLPLQYSLNGVTFQNSNIFTGLGAANYTITVKDARGCINSSSVSITSPGSTTPTFNPVAAICAGQIVTALPTTSLNGITGTWSPALNNTTTTTYTFTPATGQCASTASLTITVNPAVTPTFNAVAAICSGQSLSPLPTTSLNGITGTWSPALNNTNTTTYTFTPGSGQCASTATLTITVNPAVTPTFNAVAAICSGQSLSPLPTTSLNGITGTWSPALNNTNTTTYTFTPGAGQCASTTTLTITVNPAVTPTFNAVAAICSGQTLSPLPTSSLNGITGIWSPALNNTITTTYTFTPTAGQCASTVTLTITVNPAVTPTFNAVAAICAGQILSPLPTTSLNGIAGTWSPALNNTTTTTYTFTPTTGQCASSATLTITVNPAVTPTFNAVTAICAGQSLSPLPTTSLNGITGTWSPALNNTTTTTYTFTPNAGQCASTTTLAITVNPTLIPSFSAIGSLCQNSLAPLLSTTSTNGISGTWNPATINTSIIGTTSYTFTPDAGQCAAPTSVSISIATQITPTFTPIPTLCLNATAPVLQLTSNNGITGTWNPAVINTTATGTFNYTFTPDAAQCASASVSLSVTIAANITPAFNSLTAICKGDVLPALPTTSLNGITGSWSPALNNNATTTYTFTPDAGQCAASTTLTITVNPAVTPTFNQVAAICAGQTLSPLPTTSLNGIAGTWSPALNNTTTTTYTFTPNAGQCAVTTTLTINVNSASTVPTFNPIAAICAGQILPPLPTNSLNGITGTWSPALNNASTTTYTFTPDAGQCAASTTLTITVNPAVMPTFNQVAAICAGQTLSPLPTTSLNGIAGTWSPALNNASTTTYTFTPDAGQCASTTTLTIIVNPAITPTFIPVSAVCAGQNITALPTTSLNGISGTWTPALNNAATTTYTFTPDAGQCAASTTLTITVNPVATPTFNPIGSLCQNAIAPILPTTSLNGISGTWSPSVINTSTIGTFSYTFTPGTGECAASFSMDITIATQIIPTFSTVPALCLNAVPPVLPAISNNGITGSWNPSVINTSIAGSSSYTFTPDMGQCATAAVTIEISIGTSILPVFAPVAPVCTGQILSPLPITSLNGITGSWSPALNNLATTVYTFTPNAGQCAEATTLTLTVNPAIIPTFSAVAPVCAGVVLTPLPATSLNGITGVWSPALNNTATTTYTFTPNTGQCATTTTLTITVNSAATVPTFSPVASICAGQTLPPLPTTSLNGITGIWSPALNNTATSTYTFTPNAGQCATTTTLTISVNSAATVPTFNPVAAICAGQTLSPLPTTSLNGINGTWSPALNNTATATYTFTPSNEQCALSTTLTIMVNRKVTPTFSQVPAICAGQILPSLPITSLNGITGTWSPSLNNTTTTTYTFTPNNGQCAFSTSITIVVKPKPIIDAGRDTTIEASQPLSLNAIDVNNSGFISYLWSPADGLNNPGTKNPVTILNNTISYTVTATTAENCVATDAVTITINRVAEIFVPTAFSPGAPINRTLKAFPRGIKEFRYFVVFNRLGQQVFKTSDSSKGWDGTFKGVAQPTDGFVWIAEGIDFKNRIIKRKGNAVLIR